MTVLGGAPWQAVLGLHWQCSICCKHGHLLAVDTIVLLDADSISPLDVTVLDIVLRKYADRVRGEKGKSFAGKKVVVVGMIQLEAKVD